MGFFSEENIDWMERHDKSYPTPEQRIKWRIEELQLRLSELIMQEAEESERCLITQKPIAPPSHFWYNKQYQKTYI